MQTWLGLSYFVIKDDGLDFVTDSKYLYLNNGVVAGIVPFKI